MSAFETILTDFARANEDVIDYSQAALHAVVARPEAFDIDARSQAIIYVYLLLEQLISDDASYEFNDVICDMTIKLTNDFAQHALSGDGVKARNPKPA
jgi:hypothetical protein